QVAQPFDIYLAVLVHGPPVADLGGAVDDDVNPVNGAADGVRVGDVAGDDFGAEGLQGGQVGGRAGEGADGAAGGRPVGDVAADEPGGPGDEVSGGHRTAGACSSSPPRFGEGP